MTAERVCWTYLECMYLTKNVHKRQNSTIIYKLFLFHEKMCDTLTMLKFPMFCASNQKCPIIKVSYLLWDSYAHYGGDFLLTSNNACAKLSLLQYLSFALAKHRLRVSQTVLLCLFYRFSLTAEYAYAILNTYYEARYTAGFDPRNWKADPAQYIRQDAKGSFSKIKSCFWQPLIPEPILHRVK